MPALLDRIFYGYIVLVGLAAGALLVAAPQTASFVIKPYFWMLLAVALFDGGVFLYRGSNPENMLPMSARLLGFLIGIVLMVAIPMLAGSSVRFF